MGEEAANLLDVPVPDQPVTLCGRGLSEPWRQRLSGQRAAFPEILGFGDAPAGFGLGDPQPVGQRAAQRAAQLLLAGLCIKPVDDGVLRCAEAACGAFEVFELAEQFWGGQDVKRQVAQAVQGGVERVRDLDNLLATAATHASNFTKAHRQKRPRCDY